MAPTAYHRIRFRQRDKERMLRWANRFAIAGVCLLAVAIGTIVLLVIDVLYELRVAAAVAGTLTALIAWAWFALPLSRQVGGRPVRRMTLCPRGYVRAEHPHGEEVVMPQTAWNQKRERQYEHIKESLEERGTSEDVSEEIAARTVNKARARAGESRTASRSSLDDISSSRRAVSARTGARWPDVSTALQEAKEAGIDGRSTMNKAQLERALPSLSLASTTRRRLLRRAVRFVPRPGRPFRPTCDAPRSVLPDPRSRDAAPRSCARTSTSRSGDCPRLASRRPRRSHRGRTRHRPTFPHHM